MFRPIVVVALLVVPAAAPARPGIPALPFAHVGDSRIGDSRVGACYVEPCPNSARVCRSMHRRSARIGEVLSLPPGRSALRARVRIRSLPGGPFDRGPRGMATDRVAGFPLWSRYDDCVWGYAGVLPPAHCTDYYAF